MRQSTTLEQIEQLTAEWCDLCAHYETTVAHLVPIAPLRMRQISHALHGPGGLWERRRRELAGRPTPGDVTRDESAFAVR